MAKKKIIALFVMAALLVTAALPVLVADKTAYVLEQGFAGVMLWRESTDYAWDAVDGNGMPLSALRSIYDTACDRIVGYGENA